VNVRNCVGFFTAGHEIGADRLKNHCSELISSHWSDFTRDDFKDMNAQLLHGMLKQRTSHPLHSAIMLHRDDVVFLHLIENQVSNGRSFPSVSNFLTALVYYIMRFFSPLGSSTNRTRQETCR
jgi:hypothetical protein